MDLDVAHRRLPAHGNDVSGDVWVHVKRDDGSAVLAIADVTGHGDRAAAYAAQARQVLERVARSDTGGPADVLEHANRAWIEAGNTEEYLSAAAVVFQPGPARVTWAMAGHPAPCWLDAGQPLDGVRPGPPFGIQWQLGCTTSTRPIEPGQGLLLYTDGLENAIGPGRNRFGMNRVMHLLTDLRGHPPADIVNRLGESLLVFSEGTLPDDVLLVAVRAR